MKYRKAYPLIAATLNQAGLTSSLPKVWLDKLTSTKSTDNFFQDGSGLLTVRQVSKSVITIGWRLGARN